MAFWSRVCFGLENLQRLKMELAISTIWVGLGPSSFKRSTADCLFGMSVEVNFIPCLVFWWVINLMLGMARGERVGLSTCFMTEIIYYEIHV